MLHKREKTKHISRHRVFNNLGKCKLDMIFARSSEPHVDKKCNVENDSRKGVGTLALCRRHT